MDAFTLDITAINKSDDQVDNLRLIFKDNYKELTYLLDRLFWFDELLIFLNYHGNFSQVSISKILDNNGFNITQFGISKRLKTIDEKFNFLISIPLITPDITNIIIHILGLKNTEIVTFFLKEKSFSYIKNLTGENLSHKYKKIKNTLATLKNTQDPDKFIKICREHNANSNIDQIIKEQGFEKIKYIVSVVHTMLTETNNKHLYSSHSSKVFDEYK